MRSSTAPDRNGERGQMLIMFTFALAFLFGITALTIDVGSILHTRSDLQKTADAAALAGSLELPDSAVLAENKAEEYAVQNGIDLASGDDIEVTVSDDSTEVTVKVVHEAPFFFGRVLGFTSVDVSATATAQVGSPAALAGILPFGVLEEAVNDSLENGTPVTLKYDATNPTNGNFGPIRVDGSGSNIHEQTIMYGSENRVCAVSQGPEICPDPTVDTQTGNLIGATRDGFDYRFDNTSSACDDFDEILTEQADGTYKVKSECNPFSGRDYSKRLVLVPVVDQFPNGNGSVTILNFMALYLNDMQDNKCKGSTCEVTGTFVKADVDPTGDADLGIYDEDSGIKFVRLVE